MSPSRLYSAVNPYQSPETGCESGPRELPLRLASYIDTLLEPGEEVLWQGRSRVPWLGIVVTALAGATFLALAVLLIWHSFVLTLSAWAITSAWLLLCYSLTAGIMSGSTVWVLTNHRILICTYRWANRCTAQTYFPEEIGWEPPKLAGQPARLMLFYNVEKAEEVRSLACRTLLPRLARRLRHADPAVRRRAAAAFRRLGTAAAPFTSELLDALKSDDAIVRCRVAEALGNSGVSDAVDYLAPLRFDDDRQVANTAIQAVDKLLKPGDTIRRSLSGRGEAPCSPARYSPALQ